MADVPLIALEGVGKTYPGGSSSEGPHVAVRGAHVAIPQGAFLALIGGSGSGKTTLLKTINRLVEPDEGDVRIEGEKVGTIDPVVLRRRIGYVFQGIGLFPHFTVAENIGITPRLLGWPRERIDARVAELLDLVELPRDYAGRLPAALSGGQRQRVGVARAIAASPRIVLMDEPFGALDPLTRDALGQAYRALHDRLGLTTVMVTHDVQEAILLADRIVVMQAGRVVADGTPEALMRSPDPAVSALLGVPHRQAERIRERLGAPLPPSEAPSHG